MDADVLIIRLDHRVKPNPTSYGCEQLVCVRGMCLLNLCQ